MKNKFGITDKSFDLILETRRSFEDVDRAVMFGSRAMGNFRKGSDIDIAVCGDNLRETTAMDLSAKLNESVSIPYYVDVIAPKYIENQNLIDHVKHFGVLFYEKL